MAVYQWNAHASAHNKYKQEYDGFCQNHGLSINETIFVFCVDSDDDLQNHPLHSNTPEQVEKCVLAIKPGNNDKAKEEIAKLYKRAGAGCNLVFPFEYRRGTAFTKSNPQIPKGEDNLKLHFWNRVKKTFDKNENEIIHFYNKEIKTLKDFIELSDEDKATKTISPEFLEAYHQGKIEQQNATALINRGDGHYGGPVGGHEDGPVGGHEDGPQNKSVFSDFSMQILSGFIAALGIAAVAVAFVFLNLATFGVAGLILAGVGVAATLGGVGLFAYSSSKEADGDRLTPPTPAP